jgi:hypothetical protein
MGNAPSGDDETLVIASSRQNWPLANFALSEAIQNPQSKNWIASSLCSSQ